ncbi:MAG: hypothetical protein QXO69_01540 [archaeon]
MSIKSIVVSRKAIAAIIVAVALIAVSVLALSLIAPKPVVASLEKTTLAPGEDTTLSVSVTNPTGAVLSDVSVTASTPDRDVFISTPWPESDVIGVGETRVFRFSVIVVSSAADGQYVIKVRVPRLSEETSVRLEVKS